MKTHHMLSALCGLLFASVQVHAANFFVVNTNDSGTGSLRQAILNANAAPTQPHTIYFFEEGYPAGGVITLQSPLPTIEAEDLQIDGVISQPIIDGAGAYRIFFAGNGNRMLRIVRLELRNGYNTGADGGGGCIGSNASSSNLLVDRSTFRNCLVRGGSLMWGGAIRWKGASSALLVDRSRFIGNRVVAEGGSGQGGGGAIVASVGSITISRSWFQDNQVIASNGYAYGGAVYTAHAGLAQVLINDSTFDGNGVEHRVDLSGTGGALHFGCATCGVSLQRNWFASNLAKQGGALYAWQSDSPGSGLTLDLQNNAFFMNHATSRAGAIEVGGTTRMEAANNSFYLNQGELAGDIHFWAGAAVTGFRGNLLAGTFGLLSDSCSGTPTITGANIQDVRQNIFVSGGCIGNLANQSLPAENLGNFHLDERGFGEAISLFWFDGSSVIDAIDDAGACLDSDILGNPRPFDGDSDGVAKCDVGAFERSWSLGDPPDPSHIFSNGFED